MMEKLGRVVRNQWEDLWVFLDRGCEDPQLELRLHNHGLSGEAETESQGEWIGLPVRLLPELLQVLTHAQNHLRELGLLDASQPATHFPSPWPRLNARQFPRVTMDPAMECRIVDPAGPEAAHAIPGQIKDLSQGGAQAWIPRRFPRLKQLDVFMTIEGANFRGRAEVVGPDETGESESQGGLYRHNLRWVALRAQGMAALSKIVPAVERAEKRPPETDASGGER
jgi:hypothetical protein